MINRRVLPWVGHHRQYVFESTGLLLLLLFFINLLNNYRIVSYDTVSIHVSWLAFKKIMCSAKTHNSHEACGKRLRQISGVLPISFPHHIHDIHVTFNHALFESSSFSGDNTVQRDYLLCFMFYVFYTRFRPIS